MKKKIFYWSPCLNPVGTVISTINSASALSKYGKEYDISIINACGEWDNYAEEIKKNSINLINLNFKYFKYLPKVGFIGSRFSYIIIYTFSFFPLLFLLKKQNPHIVISHLITSLPLTLLYSFKFKTKFILRISGYPKLNFIRKLFWKKVSKKLNLITCPTKDLKSELIKSKIFTENKIFYLQDAILNSKTIINKKKKDNLNINNSNKKIILSVGRLTKQKNFTYLIKEYSKFEKINKDYILCIIGDGEEKKNLNILINKLNLNDKVFLLGYRKDIYNFMMKSEIYVLSSLWEEVGFVIVEAAINNLYVISSDCPNGPKEFLNNGQNGLLFKSNLKNDLLRCLVNYSKFDKMKKFEDRVQLKKNAIQYSKFRHYIQFEKLIYKLSY
tara:strand:+ start:35906 stop:37063 length:1158 start_codon:yes stop_codon:yes gene_type:complete